MQLNGHSYEKSDIFPGATESWSAFSSLDPFGSCLDFSLHTEEQWY